MYILLMQLRNEGSSEKLLMYFMLKNSHMEILILGMRGLPSTPKCGTIRYEDIEINGKMFHI